MRVSTQVYKASKRSIALCIIAVRASDTVLFEQTCFALLGGQEFAYSLLHVSPEALMDFYQPSD